MKLLQLEIIAIERGRVDVELADKDKSRLIVQWQGNPEQPLAFSYLYQGRHTFNRKQAKRVVAQFT